VIVVEGADFVVWRLQRQLAALAPRRTAPSLEPIVEAALPRMESIVSASALPGYHDADGTPRFDIAQTDQSAMFIWLCSNEAWRAGDRVTAADFFALNKALNAVVCMYDTQLPTIFLWIHCVGMMLGKARYAERFVAYQNVTVGTDRGARPSFGEGTILFAGTKVVGGAEIGARTVVSLNSVVIDERIPPDSVVAGRSPDLQVRPRKRWLYADYFIDEPRDPRAGA
jgi:serine O-acetyltransferase